MSYSTILVERDGSIGKLTFNRPDLLNAYNRLLSMELKDGIAELGGDGSVRVIVITGAGRAFMAGADINMIQEWTTPEGRARVRRNLEEMFTPNQLEECPKPVIAAVNGLAFGMGCEIALAADFRIASAKAKFALPEIKLGLIPGGGGSQRMIGLVGVAKALELISIGDPVDAAESLRLGLVSQVVEPGELDGAVRALADRLLDKSSLALASCKKLICQGLARSLYQGVDYERDLFCEIMRSEDAAEGAAAFLEKRRPAFKGR